jgi:hypothetical protein
MQSVTAFTFKPPLRWSFPELHVWYMHKKTAVFVGPIPYYLVLISAKMKLWLAGLALAQSAAPATGKDNVLARALREGLACREGVGVAPLMRDLPAWLDHLLIFQQFPCRTLRPSEDLHNRRDTSRPRRLISPSLALVLSNT